MLTTLLLLQAAPESFLHGDFLAALIGSSPSLGALLWISHRFLAYLERRDAQFELIVRDIRVAVSDMSCRYTPPR